jgi:CRP-like cAMP-binding protein
MIGHAMELVHPLVRRIQNFALLAKEDQDLIAALPTRVEQLRADQDIVRAGDRATRCCIILEGIACIFKVTGEGRRQITAFFFPGDIPDLQSLHLDVLDSSLGSLTPCTVAFVQHERLWDLCIRSPRTAAALWKMTLIDASVFREWVVNIGQRDAVSRVAHLLCEIAVRIRALDGASHNTFDLPITQSELADATGMSTVHTNRSLQELRAKDLIVWKGTTLEIINWAGLAKVADFSPDYLHLRVNTAA